MSSDDGQHGGSRGPDSGSFSAVVPKDRNFSRRVSVFHLVAPDGSERRPHAPAEKGSGLGAFGRDDRNGRRIAEERTWGAGRYARRLGRSIAVAESNRKSAARVSNGFCAARRGRVRTQR